MFLVDFTTGELTLQNDIDERHATLGTNQFCASFFAFSGSSQSQIGVGLYRVVDTNQNTPNFTRSTFNLALSEDQSLNTVVFDVIANDTDTGEDGRLTYNITSGNVNETFSLNATSGQLSLRKHLDYEKRKTFMLSISATDNGRIPRSSSATISVTVTDVNDNAPYFLQSTYNVSILEDAALGSEILTLLAVDADSGINGVLRYSLQSVVPEFSIDSASGALLLSQSLDYEKKKSYTVRVNVTDLKYSSQVSVIITVQNVDECRLATCYNGGTCLEGDASYTCLCASGYTGEHCETDIDECSSIPCQNNGQCLDDVNGYICSCNPGFTGLYCQTDIDECISSPCQNIGTCLDSVNHFMCACAPGYTGLHCEINYDECSSRPCLNNATCIDGINSFACLCQDGYTGLQCESHVNECQSNPCQSDGTCSDNVNSYICTCAAGYTGVHCETDYDECSSNPCYHKSTCIDEVNAYYCSCSEEYTGLQCESKIDECRSSDCQG